MANRTDLSYFLRHQSSTCARPLALWCNEVAAAQVSQQVFDPVALLCVAQYIRQLGSQHRFQILTFARREVAQVLQYQLPVIG